MKMERAVFTTLLQKRETVGDNSKFHGTQVLKPGLQLHGNILAAF